MRLLRMLALAGALSLAAAPPASAEATPEEVRLGTQVLAAYTNTGTIDPCRYPLAQLEAALEFAQQADVRQYGSDFPAAVRDAIAARARGACEEPTPTSTPDATAAPVTSSSSSTGGAVPPATGDGGAGIGPAGSGTQTVVPEPPGPDAIAASPQPAGADPAFDRAAGAAPGNGTPVPLIGLGVLSSLALLTVLMLGALRRLGAGGGPLAPAYHSWREAQWRAGGVFDDFRDWLHQGR